MTMTEVPDLAAREQALDPRQSFIIQAPAGSGKTELLTQRMLRLLAGVEQPESVLAITFTRKAAAEMRHRISASLRAARDEPEPEAAHQRRTWQLASQALAQDQKLNWDLLDNPDRLRVQTIDSLCASLTRQMPWLSGFGGQPGIVEDATVHYQRAAELTLENLEQDNPWSAAVASLLQHLDNNRSRVVELLVQMLAGRDRWMRHLHASDDRRELEQGLQEVSLAHLRRLRRHVPEAVQTDLFTVAHFAAFNLAAQHSDSPITHCLGLNSVPGDGLDDLPVWLGLAELCLKKDGLRKTVTSKQGFPAPSQARDKAGRQRLGEYKSRMLELLQRLTEFPQLVADLEMVRRLPGSGYTDEQWQVVGSAVQVLKLAAAQLQLVFREQGEVDFTQLSQSARAALGSGDRPSDLGLAMDYRIQHLLVDEFQDTSVSQYEMLERLVEGWMPGDGHSLFLVGDPMQSIYRFRDADVGLFLRVRRYGLGQLKPLALNLLANFRSQAGLVDWFNGCFGQIMPDREELATGAVPFAPAVPVLQAAQLPALVCRGVREDGTGVEARAVAELVRDALARAADHTVAILVRSRAHLVDILAELRQQRIAFRAVEIDTLAECAHVQDLLTITRALCHNADRVAWLSLLRAPWCGLCLDDLLLVAQASATTDVYQALQDAELLQRLSVDARTRLLRIRPVLDAAMLARGRGPLQHLVESTWLALGGPACLQHPSEFKDVEVFLGLLEARQQEGLLDDPVTLEEELAKLYAAAEGNEECRVQVMTVHKSKGLEFDTVILPALNRRARSDQAPLMAWLEWGGEQAHSQALLLSIMREAGNEHDAIYRFIWDTNKARAHNETIRLLYVAATRARQQLCLLATLHENDEGEVRQAAGQSLLQHLWPVVEEAMQSSYHRNLAPAAQTGAPPERAAGGLYRLPAEWSPPPGCLRHDPVAPSLTASAVAEEVEFSWARESIRHVGTVVHQALQQMAGADSGAWTEARITALAPVYLASLRQLGVPAAELDGAVARVTKALFNVLEDERGRWLLSAQHVDAYNEYALSGELQGNWKHFVLDRTFVDQQGVRWIVDYKTSSHEGAGLAAFLDNETSRYREQLQNYARLFSCIEQRPIRLGLYFPLLKEWREWPYQADP